jgi:mannose-6-phosphate isomerase-like protein (cupin superfamily)
MTQRTQGTITSAKNRPREGWDALARGDATWFTLFSGDITPTGSMSAGIMEIMPNGEGLKLHRHAQPEIYYVAEGTGAVMIDGIETMMSAGCAAFIPGDAEHGIRNVADTVLRIFYVFPVDRFSEVIYRFPNPARGNGGRGDLKLTRHHEAHLARELAESGGGKANATSD